MESQIAIKSIRTQVAESGDVAAKTAGLNRQQTLLNIGCGEHFHPAWANLDLLPQHPSIVAHDVKKGLPFGDRGFDAVYHSHVLEHLSPESGQFCIKECYRVLKPGGVLRIVIPDLERIAELYIETHIRAWKGDPNARYDYHWMKLELLDQLVRPRSGGLMGPYMANPDIKNPEFVRMRLGNEFLNCMEWDEQSDQPAANENAPLGNAPLGNKPTEDVGVKSSILSRLSEATYELRRKLAKRCVRILLGREAKSALDEGLFRMKGEIHRWMYDRFSLREACEKVGFKKFRVVSASQSQIANFGDFELDVVDGLVRKPDSLFAECRKSDE